MTGGRGCKFFLLYKNCVDRIPFYKHFQNDIFILFCHGNKIFMDHEIFINKIMILPTVAIPQVKCVCIGIYDTFYNFYLWKNMAKNFGVCHLKPSLVVKVLHELQTKSTFDDYEYNFVFFGLKVSIEQLWLPTKIHKPHLLLLLV